VSVVAAAVVKNSSDGVVSVVVAAAAAAAVEEEEDAISVVVLLLVDTVIVRVLLLPQECRAASHNGRRQRSLWTEWASQKKGSSLYDNEHSFMIIPRYCEPKSTPSYLSVVSGNAPLNALVEVVVLIFTDRSVFPCLVSRLLVVALDE